MNRRIFIVIVGLLVLLGNTNAQTLSVETIEGKVGEQTVLTVSLADAAAATALQFNLSLPENVTVDEGGCALGNAATNHTLSVNKMDNGNYLFVMYSMDFTALTDGTLLTIPVNIGNGAVTGYGNLNTVRSAKSDAVSQQHQNVSFPITIVEPNYSISLNKSEAILKKGKTMTLKATITPETQEDKSVTWKSSDTKIATVSSSGKVTGVKSGVVTITCTSNATGLSATCKVTVATIALNKKEVVVRKKNSVTLTPTVYPTTLADKSVTWKSSDKTIATVSSSGKVTGVKSGVVTITCTSNATGVSTTCKVTVGTITLDKKEVVVRKKNSVTLTPTVYPTTLEDKSVTWKSSDESVATVSSTGKVTGIVSGVVTITCTSNATGLSTTCKVTVGTITLNKKEVVVRKKNSVTLTPTVYPLTLEDKSVTWKSSDESVATVSGDGVVTGIVSGVVTITCTSNATGLSTTCKVTVGTITLSKKEATINVGKTVTLTPTVYPLTLEDKSVKWKSSNKAVATVSSSGKVTGVKAGTATITCTSVATGLSTTCKVTVTAASARTLDEEDAELTDIEIVETPAVEEPVDVYDLGGRQVLKRVTSLDGLPAGVYIVNGKKVLKK